MESYKRFLSMLFIIKIFLTCLVSANDELLECEAALFTERDAGKFQSTLENANKLGVRKQVILEARFLYYVDTENYKGIASIHPDFTNQLKIFDIDHSKIFSSREQWQSVIEYSLAMEALEKNDQKRFKKHITEAFWLSPETSSAFSHHITQLRNKQYLEKLKVNMETSLQSLVDLQSVTLKQLLKEKDAIVLRFWSPWTHDIDTTFPLVQSAALQCSQHKIAFTSILFGNDKALQESAKEIMTEQRPMLKTTWLIEAQKKSLTKYLRISTLPTLVVLTKEGSISYYGNVSSNEFWNSLTKINANIKKP